MINHRGRRATANLRMLEFVARKLGLFNKAIILLMMATVVYFIFVSFRVPVLTEKEALLTFFGNYDETNQTSLWKSMSFPLGEGNGYFSKGVGVVSVSFFQSYREDGKMKFFLLTKTIPIDVPFECHACRPLLSGAVFSLDKNVWKIESQQQFLGYDGEYGLVPDAKLIQIGPDKHGLMLVFKYESDMTAVEEALLVPYQGNITKAYQDALYYDDFNLCEHSYSCAAYSTRVEFDKSKKQRFYPLKVSKFGTDNDPRRGYKAVPVDEEAVYQFQSGKYVEVARSGRGPVSHDD